MKVQAKFTSKLSTTWLAKKQLDWDGVALQMATDVDRIAKIFAPYDKGNLVNSGRIDKKAPGSYTISFGGTSGGVDVPYAKRRHFENLKNPQTLGYLERAGDQVSKQKKKYTRGK